MKIPPWPARWMQERNPLFMGHYNLLLFICMLTDEGDYLKKKAVAAKGEISLKRQLGMCLVSN